MLFDDAGHKWNKILTTFQFSSGKKSEHHMLLFSLETSNLNQYIIYIIRYNIILRTPIVAIPRIKYKEYQKTNHLNLFVNVYTLNMRFKFM